jgi:hypothetical protein
MKCAVRVRSRDRGSTVPFGLTFWKLEQKALTFSFATSPASASSTPCYPGLASESCSALPPWICARCQPSVWFSVPKTQIGYVLIISVPTFRKAHLMGRSGFKLTESKYYTTLHRTPYTYRIHCPAWWRTRKQKLRERFGGLQIQNEL